MTEQLTTVLATGPPVPLPINNCPTLHLVPSSHAITLSTSSRHVLAFCHPNSASCFPLPSLLQRYPPALPFLQLQRSRHLLPDSGSGLPVRYLNQSSFWFLLSLIQQIPLEPLFWARCWATPGTQGDTHICSVLQEPTGQSTHGSTCLFRLLPTSHGPGLSHGPTSL